MEAGKSMSSLQILALFFLCLCITAASDDPAFYPKFAPFITSGPHEYTRFADVARHCKSVLSSAGELWVPGPDQTGLPTEMLSFMHGDWSQDAGQAPLLPFQGTYADDAAVAGGPGQPEAVSLASFVVTHMDTAPPRRGAAATAFNVSGLLTLSISRNCCCYSMEPHPRPEFVLRPGVAKLQIQFEGVYTEKTPLTVPATDEDGESVLCMVGNAVLPVRGSNSSDPWDWAKSNRGAVSSKAPPPVMAADDILLVLRFPRTRTLATRAVLGEMTSTSAAGSAYFDKVRLVSRLHRDYFRYQYRPQDVTSGCSDGDAAAGPLYQGPAFCDILRQFTPDENSVLDVVPNRNCRNSSDEFCSPLGPFKTGRPATSGATAAAFARSGIAVQGVECEKGSGKHGAAGGWASAVFRFVPPWEHRPTAAKRTGLNGVTLSAEGELDASTGRLCMVACIGVEKVEACRHRVTLFIPTTFSITRRSIVVGQITSKDDGHSPVTFRQAVSPRQSWQQFDRPWEAMRTKVEQAGELLRRRERSGFRDTFIAKSFLSYPKLAGAADDNVSLSNLGEDLGLRFQLVSKPQFVPEWIEEPFFQLQILSVGSLVGSYQRSWYHGDPGFRYQGDRRGMQFQQISRRSRGVEKQEVLNVSAEFTAPSWKFSGSTSPVMSLEGVYNPEDGRMHLIGCRDVHALSTSRDDLEDGMDCSIEVTVEYPPTTTRWLISPAATVHVASTRRAGDRLHFNRTVLRSLPIVYRDQRDELSEAEIEGRLCIAMLSATIAATASQLRHIGSHPDVAPYVSLSMLGVQALGYGATLVMDAKTLPAWPTGPRYREYIDHLRWDMDCSVKALTLAALLLAARLAQKVLRARARARARSPLEPGRVPSDVAVLICSFAVYLGGLFVVLAARWLSTSGASTGNLQPGVLYFEAQGTSPPQTHTRDLVVERYVGAVKEWFLLPQVIGNAVWRVNCKPLAARYYAGVTAVWLLPHVYGYLRPPVVHGARPDAQHGALGFYSNAVAVTVPVVGVVLALAVYVQQRWNYRIVGWVKKGGQHNKLQHVY
ncbi:hypothetical protein EJB05_25053, partial [Eragrostis curvula]